MRGVVRDFTAVWRHTHLYTHTLTRTEEREKGEERERVSVCVLLRAWTGHD